MDQDNQQIPGPNSQNSSNYIDPEQKPSTTSPLEVKSNGLLQTKSASELAVVSILFAFVPFVVGLLIAIICDIFGIDMSKTAEDIEMAILIGIFAVLQLIFAVLAIKAGLKQNARKTYIIVIVIAFLALISSIDGFVKTIERLTN